MKAVAVIGANYGDEGKGLITDYFTRNLTDPIVVRYNGGAQAGHTVVTPEGMEHVFSHLGAGTLAGAPTFLSEFFVVNPIRFSIESKALIENAPIPTVFVDRRAFVTTPFDMIVNQAIELSRQGSGAIRHGSCGSGVFETIQRSKIPEFRLTVGDIYYLTREAIENILVRIRDEWIPTRVDHYHGVFNESHLIYAHFDGLIERYLDDVEYFCDQIKMHTCPHFIKNSFGSVIFEGAQGLALDQNNVADMPFLTPSNTGLQNIVALAPQMGVHNIEAHYVSRTYLTRHGAGPLPGEDTEHPWPECNTNKTNVWQGPMRFAPLDYSRMLDRIVMDIHSRGKAEGIHIDPVLDFTHSDVGIIPFLLYSLGKIQKIDASVVWRYGYRHDNMLVSCGRTHEHVWPVEKIMDEILDSCGKACEDTSI